MSAPYKVKETYQHTETVYYSEDGFEVHRERSMDDGLYDEDLPEPLTADEMEDLFPSD